MISVLKWLAILVYWIVLDWRNIHSYVQKHDWRLMVQILVNTVVIGLIIVEEFGQG